MNLALLALTLRMSTRFMTTASSKGFVIFQATEECAKFAELASVMTMRTVLNGTIRHGLVSLAMYLQQFFVHTR